SFFINDLDASTSSYNTSSTNATIYYTSTGHHDIVIDGVNYRNFVYIPTNRPLPVMDPSMPSALCEGDVFTMNTTTPGTEYEWVIFPATGTTMTPVGIFTTSVASWTTPITGTVVNYVVRLRVKNDCC